MKRPRKYSLAWHAVALPGMLHPYWQCFAVAWGGWLAFFHATPSTILYIAPFPIAVASVWYDRKLIVIRATRVLQGDSAQPLTMIANFLGIFFGAAVTALILASASYWFLWGIITLAERVSRN